jgi:hypothetical protein
VKEHDENLGKILAAYTRIQSNKLNSDTNFEQAQKRYVIKIGLKGEKKKKMEIGVKMTAVLFALLTYTILGIF